MKKLSSSDNPLRQEWEALGRQIDQMQGFTDAQLAGLYDRVDVEPSVECPALPPDERAIAISRLRALSLAAVAVLVVLLLPLPSAMATESDAEHAASVEAVGMVLAKVNMCMAAGG